MCDTLATNHINSVLNNKNHAPLYGPKKYEELETKTGITEPDNGHKTAETVKSAIKEVDLTVESERLKTYRDWKSEVVTPAALAKAGFYSLNKGDLVKCAFCKVEICKWEAEDDPMEEHARWAPLCSFVRDKSGRIGSALDAAREGQDVCGTGEHFPNSVPESEMATLLKSMIRSQEDFATRLASFEDWPKSLKQKPRALAEAGFLYKGVGDQALCFECGGGLKDWEDDDDPWEQHAMWFPRCKFLLQTKGHVFVDEVQGKLKNRVPRNTKDDAEGSKCAEGASTSNEDSSKLCKICYSNEKEVVFIPCSHLLACMKCAMSLNDKKCPVCRKHIDGTIRVFPS